MERTPSNAVPVRVSCWLPPLPVALPFRAERTEAALPRALPRALALALPCRILALPCATDVASPEPHALLLTVLLIPLLTPLTPLTPLAPLAPLTPLAPPPLSALPFLGAPPLFVP